MAPTCFNQYHWKLWEQDFLKYQFSESNYQFDDLPHCFTPFLCNFQTPIIPGSPKKSLQTQGKSLGSWWRGTLGPNMVFIVSICGYSTDLPFSWTKNDDPKHDLFCLLISLVWPAFRDTEYDLVEWPDSSSPPWNLPVLMMTSCSGRYHNDGNYVACSTMSVIMHTCMLQFMIYHYICIYVYVYSVHIYIYNICIYIYICMVICMYDICIYICICAIACVHKYHGVKCHDIPIFHRPCRCLRPRPRHPRTAQAGTSHSRKRSLRGIVGNLQDLRRGSEWDFLWFYVILHIGLFIYLSIYIYVYMCMYVCGISGIWLILYFI